MQYAPKSQNTNAQVERRMLHPLGHSVVPISLKSAVQRSPDRRKPARVLRSVKTEHPQNTQAPLRVLADGNTARGGETGSGLFFEAQEEAARRIAHRLHDESAQMLATVYLELAMIARDSPDSTVRKIDQVVKQLDGVREQLRGLSHELSPPVLDQLGLMPALQSLANGVQARSGLKLVVSGSTGGLPHLVSAVLYRVVQEALSNVVRHAKATEAEVKLKIGNDKVICTVSDDGVGFKTPEQQQQPQPANGAVNNGRVNGPINGPINGLGLPGIVERVTALKGQCQITSGPKGGMQLQVEIPL